MQFNYGFILINSPQERDLQNLCNAQQAIVLSEDAIEEEQMLRTVDRITGYTKPTGTLRSFHKFAVVIGSSMGYGRLHETLATLNEAVDRMQQVKERVYKLNMDDFRCDLGAIEIDHSNEPFYAKFYKQNKRGYQKQNRKW